jgi:Family of unknown function (DUF5752)
MARLNAAETPFDFVTATYLTRIGDQSAGTLAELLTGLENCSDASIFHHTFQTLGAHHFLTEGFSNDFAQWTLSSVNRSELAELLAVLDIRDYLSIAALRSDLCRVVRDFCASQPQSASQSGLERFHFCESVEVTMPLGRSAGNLDEFRRGLEHLSHAGFYYHFISSRLRLQLQTNDFSRWLSGSLGLRTLADSINHIDVYTNTLDSARAKMLRLIDRERRKA